jgi:hypothetical protein
MKSLIAGIVVLASLAVSVRGQTPGPNAAFKTTTVPLDRLDEQQPRNVKTEWVTYKGRKALRVIDAAPPDVADGIQLVVLNKTEFRDGTIEIELTGEPSPMAKSAAPRGFVGVAFRVNLDAAKDLAKYECFYLRPTNGRADDQVRRNHSTQYISYPDFPWFRLRKEFPEKYESYADVVPGEWTKLKIEVHGDKACTCRARRNPPWSSTTSNKRKARLPYGLEPKRSRTSPIYAYHRDFWNPRPRSRSNRDSRVLGVSSAILT